METTYTVRGADGREYGPVSFDQVTTWMRDGRVQAASEVRRNDMQHWARAGDFTELKDHLPITLPAGTAPAAFPASPVGATPATPDATASIIAQLKSAASWFYWIAGLSLINTISAFFGSDWRFIVGLGVTQIIDEFGKSLGTAGHAIALTMDIAAAGLFIFLGVFAHKRHLWAFIIGMVLFALDGVVTLLAQAWLSVALHALVLFFLFRGVQACQALKAQGVTPG